MIFYQLADRLHKSVAEIRQLSFAEIAGWIAFFKITEAKKVR